MRTLHFYWSGKSREFHHGNGDEPTQHRVHVGGSITVIRSGTCRSASLVAGASWQRSVYAGLPQHGPAWIMVYIMAAALALAGCLHGCAMQLELRRYEASSPGGPVVYYVGNAPGSQPQTRALLYLRGTAGPAPASADFGKAVEATKYGFDVVYPERRHAQDPARFSLTDSRQARLTEASAVLASLVERGVKHVLVFAESEATMFAPELAVSHAANTVGLVCISGSVTPFAEDLLWTAAHPAPERRLLPLPAERLAEEFGAIRRTLDTSDKIFWGHSYLFWNSYLDYDPVPHLRRVSFPVLYVNGEFDEVDLARQAFVIATLRRGGIDIEAQVLKGYGHELGPARSLLARRIVEWARRKGLILDVTSRARP